MTSEASILDRLSVLVTRVCVEKLHRAPEECEAVHWPTIWRLVVIAGEEYEELKRMEQKVGGRA